MGLKELKDRLQAEPMTANNPPLWIFINRLIKEHCADYITCLKSEQDLRSEAFMQNLELMEEIKTLQLQIDLYKKLIDLKE